MNRARWSRRRVRAQALWMLGVLTASALSSPGAQADTRPGGQAGTRPGAQADTRPGAQAGTRPIARPTSVKGQHAGAPVPKEARAKNAQTLVSTRGTAAKADDAGPAPTDEVPRPPNDDRDRDRVLRLQETISEILHNRTLGRLRVGLRVMSARTGRLFYGRRGETLMDPASNQKVLATTAALMRLGGDWRYRTEVTGPAPDDEGVIHGSIHIRGNGDPTLRSVNLEDMAVRLRERGVTCIDGAVVADARLLAATPRRGRRRAAT